MILGKKWQYNLQLFWEWMKVILFNAINIIETIDRTNLTDQTKFRLSEITKIENYFNHEIKKWKLNNKKLSKDKILVVLIAASGGVYLISFTLVIGAPVGIKSANFTLVFYLTTWVT